MVDLWRKHESVEATVYTEFVTVIETFVLVFQMTSHVDHQQRLLQGELFAVVLDVVAVVVTIPKLAQCGSRKCTRNVACRAHELFALVQHNETAPFILGRRHGMAPSDGGAVVADRLYCWGYGLGWHSICAALLFPFLEVGFVEGIVMFLELSTANFENLLDEVHN